MAEFCLDCLNKLCGTEDPSWKYVFSRELDLCEECGQWKHVVVRERNNYFLRRTGLDIFLSICYSPKKKRRS